MKHETRRTDSIKAGIAQLPDITPSTTIDLIRSIKTFKTWDGKEIMDKGNGWKITSGNSALSWVSASPILSEDGTLDPRFFQSPL